MNKHQAILVKSAIQNVVKKFERAPNVFLTEDDLRSHVFGQLIKAFGEEKATKDGDLSIPIHTEVRWYGSDGTLKLRSDVVIVDVSTLQVLKYNKMPSKGYGFNIPEAIIELKLRRPNGESDNQYREKIREDVEKLNELADCVTESGNPKPIRWVIALDKKKKLTNVPKGEKGVRLIYRFADIRRRIGKAKKGS